MSDSISPSLEFFVWEYVDAEFLFLFEEISTNSLEMKHINTYKCKIVSCFINGDNTKVLPGAF